MTKLQDFLNSPLSEVSAPRLRAKTGDLFGLELECEGRNVAFDGRANDPLLTEWRPEHDGSLRAHHGAPQEWVFNGPVGYEQAVKRVHALFDWFQKKHAQIVTSNRTSVHLHYNMGDKNAYQLVNLFILYTIFEEVLDNYCGDDRNGNLFCLSTRNAEGQLQWMMDSCFKNYSFKVYREDFRYCSLNIASINKFGTVEFRGMRGLDNREDVLTWLSILSEFCDYACYKMKNPIDIVQMVSAEGPMGLMKKVWSAKNIEHLLKGVADSYLERSVFEGVRLVQMLCYKIGTEFEQVRLRGRDFWATLGGGAQPPIDEAERLLKKAPRARGFNRLDPFVRPEDQLDGFRPRWGAAVPQGVVKMNRARPIPIIDDEEDNF